MPGLEINRGLVHKWPQNEQQFPQKLHSYTNLKLHILK